MKKRTQTHNLTSQGKNKKILDKKLSTNRASRASIKRKKGKVKKI